MPEPKLAAAITPRPVGVPIRIGIAAESLTCPTVFFLPDTARRPNCVSRARRPARGRAPAHRPRDGRLHVRDPANHRAVRARPRLHGAGRARGRPQRPRADHDAARPARDRPLLLRRRLAPAGDPARPDPRRAPGRLGRDPAEADLDSCRPRSRSSGAGPPAVPGRRAGCSTTSPAGDRALRRARLQPAALRAHRDRRARGRRDDRGPDQAQEPATTRSTRCPPAASRGSPAGSAGSYADAHPVLRAGRRQQPRADRPLRRPDAALGIDRDLDGSRPRSPGSRPSSSGPRRGSAGPGVRAPRFRGAVEAAQARRATGGRSPSVASA